MATKSPTENVLKKNLLLNSVDWCGRQIDPDVLNVANSIASRLISFAEGLIRDPALATSLLEESAASVSRVVRKRAQLSQPPITRIDAYLFRTYARRVNKARWKEPLLSRVPYDSVTKETGYLAELDLRVLINEFAAHCDAVPREMLYWRLQGKSWKEIAKVYGISAHAAEARFSYQLNKIRRRLRFK